MCSVYTVGVEEDTMCIYMCVYLVCDGVYRRVDVYVFLYIVTVVRLHDDMCECSSNL